MLYTKPHSGPSLQVPALAMCCPAAHLRPGLPAGHHPAGGLLELQTSASLGAASLDSPAAAPAPGGCWSSPDVSNTLWGQIALSFTHLSRGLVPG